MAVALVDGSPTTIVEEINRLLASSANFGEQFENIEFGDWVARHIYLPQPDVQSSITPPFMEAFLVLSGTWQLEIVPDVWKERFGPSATKRFVAAFLGGVIIMYGARLAGGCTSGHGISGGLQLALSSWLFLAVMFATGLAVSAVLFRKS